jgi:hypothetical protein
VQLHAKSSAVAYDDQREATVPVVGERLSHALAKPEARGGARAHARTTGEILGDDAVSLPRRPAQPSRGASASASEIEAA